MVLLPLIWYILYLDFYRALSSAALLSKDNISHWLCYARGYTEWSARITFDQLDIFSPYAFFRYSSDVSTVVHLLDFYSDILSNPFQTTPLRSPESNLFSPAPHSRTVGITGTASLASARHTASHPPLSPSEDSIVSSATADTILQPDLASFIDSVQSSLDKMQKQFHDVT